MSKVLDKLNEQMNFEYESAYIYKQMAMYADDIDLPGFAHWLNAQSREEIEHAEKMLDFLQDVGYEAKLTGMSEPKADYENIEEVVKTAFDHEKEVTRRINEIADLAREEDKRVYSFIQWYIDEQVEEEANFDQLTTRLERINGNWSGLYILDGELKHR
ncbi:MAG: ferritin [Tissierellia bacterium]|nr:ferritin [Tissierellia bacterium]